MTIQANVLRLRSRIHAISFPSIPPTISHMRLRRSPRARLLAIETHCVFIVSEKEIASSIDDLVRTVAFFLKEIPDLFLDLRISVRRLAQQIDINPQRINIGDLSLFEASAVSRRN